MEDLIDLEDPPDLNKNNNFGIIKHECFVTNVIGTNSSSGEILKAGTLIQILPDYRGDGCHFMILDFTNWMDKYKTAIFKCSRDDFIMVTIELWPYLLALEKVEGRIKFVQKVYSREYDLGVLKLGSVIRIRMPPDAAVKYYEFEVVYNGVVEEIGVGYYVGLRLKNDHVCLTPDLKYFSKNYRLGGMGIVVPADWIMLNLYKEERKLESPNITHQNDSSSLTKSIDELNFELSENIFNSVQWPSTPVKINEPSVKPNIHRRLAESPYDTATLKFFNLNNNNIPDNQLNQSAVTDPNARICPNEDCKNIWVSPRNEQANNERCSKCKMNWCYICSNAHELGERHGIKSSKSKTNEVHDSHSKHLLATTYNNIPRPSPPMEEPNNISETGTIPKIRHNLSKTEGTTNTKPSNYSAQIELINNTNTSMKYVAKVQCNFCIKRVEIGHAVALRNCQHTFCIQCIRGYVERNSKISEIRCPFKNEYKKCQFNMLDTEIKDLGGDLVYNKILDNRLKESVGADSNARVCPNKDCKNIWVSQRKEHANYERCPKCKTNWCYICSSIHEPGKRHGTTTTSNEPKIVTVRKREVAKTLLGTCAQCGKSNIMVNGCASLQKCSHKFCKNCMSKFMNQTLGSQYAQCTICKKQSNEKVIKTSGLEMLKLFLNNRNDQPDLNANKLCCCKPTTPNCFLVLKCKHQFCRTFLMGILQEQLQHISRTVCPSCLEEIDDYQKTQLFVQMKPDIVEKCKMCSNQADVHLAICRHPFCRNCAGDMIANQVFDPIKTSVNCIACHNPITELDISRYGKQEIYDLYKSKIETTKVVPKLIERITFNDRPFHCVLCKKKILVKRGVILTGCQDTVCIACCKEIIGQQLSSSQLPACPICQKLLKQFEVEAINGRPIIMPNGNPILIDCLKCEQKFEERLIRKCSKCANSICLKCFKSTILGQIANNILPNCSCCHTLLDESQIASISRTTFRIQPKRETSHDKIDSPQPVEIPFECIMCEKSADRTSQIVLTKCKHEICRKCLHEKISDQMIWSQTPKCPICVEYIDQIQLDTLGISTIIKQSAKPSQNRKSSSESSDKSDTCSVCYGKFRHKIALKNCGHEFCRQCVQANIGVQQSNGTVPKCPMCRKPIDSNEIPLFNALPPISNAAEISQLNRESYTTLQLNNRSFICTLCSLNIDPECGIVLANCGDLLCRDCISNVLLQQSGDNLIANCPICQIQITDEEICTLNPAVHDIFMENRRHYDSSAKRTEFESRNDETALCAMLELEIPTARTHRADEPRGSRKSSSGLYKKADTCSICFANFRQRFDLKNCGHEFCRQCVQKNVAMQESLGTVPRCPMCRTSIELDQLTMLKALPPISNAAEVIQPNRKSYTPLQLNNRPFKCTICDRNIDTECGIVLANCYHSLCRDCISSVILQQSANNLAANCPMCLIPVTDDEVRALNPAVHDIFNENRLDYESSAGFHEFGMRRRSEMRSGLE